MSATTLAGVLEQATPDQQNRTNTILKAMTSATAEFPLKKPTVCPLTSYSVIEIAGPDAEKFMQGQFTCDLKHLKTNEHSIGACCNNKGRMLGVFRIVRLSTENFLLRLPAEVAESLIIHLTKYKAFFNCSCKINADWSCIAWFGATDLLTSTLANLPENSRTVVSTEEHLVIRPTPNGDYVEVWIQKNMADKWLAQVVPDLDIASEAIWNLAEIKSGFGEIYNSTAAEYIPQMFNLQVLGGISFNKGCYTGQEIVARMQYLGKLKKRLYLVNLSGPGVGLNEKVYDDKQTKTGNIIRLQHWQDDKQLGLAVLDNQLALQAQPLWAGPGKLNTCQIMPLPYDVPNPENQRPTQT